ncbi:hypothetical protein B2G71_01160 [Novosphingobium sp. PC22D]|uniref:nuclear transport factor 2 family protein n=1 Tax=Novosphingobium sp. PC22D TaxID=1962403 RepID=UPI000BF1318F|nr:nuclear transport factor 2 family protein [Novosphingobium sp. PC22D]PEQ14244.1 hypothetical protein B2G71_01160 [Novosphingobium sp. PC22D]
MTDDTADRLAIMDKMHRYCRAVDRLDVAQGYAVFHEDSTTDFGAAYKGTGHGWIDYICKRHRDFLHHSHQVTNAIIEIDGDRAGSESYVFATLRERIEDKVVQRQFWARYVDTWSKRDGDWAIDARECVIDFDSQGVVTPMAQHDRAARDNSDPSYSVLKEIS